MNANRCLLRMLKMCGCAALETHGKCFFYVRTISKCSNTVISCHRNQWSSNNQKTFFPDFVYFHEKKKNQKISHENEVNNSYRCPSRELIVWGTQGGATLSSVKSVPKSVSRKERPTERASRRRSPKKNSDINFFAEKCQIFEKKWQSFAEKERKIPLFLAKIRVFTLKWVFFALKSDFRKIFAEKSVPTTQKASRRASEERPPCKERPRSVRDALYKNVK